MTQRELVRNHLDEKGSITAAEAIDRYGIYRLASRMSELKKEGYRFRKEFITSKNRYGQVCSYAKYIKEEPCSSN